MANSSMTFTYDDGADGAGLRGRIRKVLIDWLSDDSDGTCTGTSRKIVGELIKGVTDPGSSAPTDNYDIAITDGEGMDVLGPALAALGNRDTTNSEYVYFGITDGTVNTSAFPVVCDALTVAITNAGNAKTGQLILYYRT
jgi:hypothetical protein